MCGVLTDVLKATEARVFVCFVLTLHSLQMPFSRYGKIEGARKAQLMHPRTVLNFL